jgi:hypothetical protein
MFSVRKILLLAFIFIAPISKAQITDFEMGEARGLFLGLGVGPRFAVGSFADNHFFASGFEATLSYGDNNSIPFFVYGKFNFASFPSEFVDVLDKPSFEIYTRFFALEPGIRYFFPPISDEVVLLMPFVEGGMNLALVHSGYQLTTGYKTQYTEDEFKFGIHAGFGVSMFLLDALISYNYFYEYQFIGFSLRVRIPIFIKI